MRLGFFRAILRGRRGQTTVEYLLTTVALVVVFASLFGFIQGRLKFLFEKAGMKILAKYPRGG